MTTKQEKAQEKAEAVEKLRGWLKPGAKVYTILRHRSSSGMQRRISVFAMLDGEPFEIDWLVGRALGLRRHDDGGLVVRGCGADMGFHIVYELARTLYPEGHECAGEGCPSNDHSSGDRDYGPHTHRDGGYALRQKWL